MDRWTDGKMDGWIIKELKKPAKPQISLIHTDL